ncbi:MAG TPA: class I SAM-dependent methyltransferase [Acidimicrobiales bacterium]|jgi:SAM-dependent methyltransferase
MSRDRRWGRASLVAAGVIVATGLQLQAKVRALKTLSPPPPNDRQDPDHLFLVARGVVLDDATRQAASAYARAEDLDVLDLVPQDLDVERAIEVLRWTDPGSYRKERLAVSRGPAQALLVSRSLVERAKLDVRMDLSPAELTMAAETAKKFAPTRSDLAIAPGLSARPFSSAERAELVQAVLDFGARPYVAVETILGVVLGAGAVAAVRRRDPRLALPLAAYLLQPQLAFGGTGLRPADLGRGTVGRLPRRLFQLAGMARALTVLGRNDSAVEDRRATYDELLAEGTDRFFEPRRADCYLCGGTDLSPIVDTSELLQCKPGRFVIEKCGSCGHVFQNPRLSADGLAFYYRDYYDGLGERPIELLFGTQSQVFRARADMVRGLAQPARWIDVGADRGQFCLVASELWPDTRFEGLDMSEGIEDGERRGWVSRGHRGQLVELADDLAGSYDVVSMHHYLEHTPDPRAELDAATKLLQPGGHLLVEVPDPEFPLARLMGNWWGSYLPAQHLHLLSIGNLERLLVERGYEVVRRTRGRAHVLGSDFAWAAYLLFQRVAPPINFPWLPRPSGLARARRMLGFGLVAPLLVLALGLDVLVGLAARVADRSNAYRVVARKLP